jgi:NADPH:quinone reductase
MRAVVIKSYGGLEGLDLQEVETPPAPTGTQVRVRVHAAGLNRADILQRRGHYPPPSGYPENIPGLEFAGEVEATGSEAHRWKTGDRVFGLTAAGAQAEFVVVDESNLAQVPAELSWVEAAAIPEVFVTAHDALFTRANLQKGESVLVHAVGSGVGTAAAQLAHAAGAIVFGTSRTSDKLDRVRDLGLKQSIAVGDTPEKFAKAVLEWTNDRGVDVILDLVGGKYFPANLQSLAVRGRLICVGTTAGPKSEIDISVLMRKRASIIGTVLRPRSIAEKAEAIRKFADAVLPLVRRGQVRPVVEAVYRAEEVRAAHEHLESNRTVGKVVLTFS